MGLVDAANVKEEQITLSFLLIPKTIKARWIADVPLFNATTCELSDILERFFSNKLIWGPTGAIQLVLKASLTYFCSFDEICGDDSHILLLLVKLII